MRILWHNVFALALAILAIVILVFNRKDTRTFLESMQDIGPGHTTDEQVMGLIAFGLVLVGIVAVLKILIENNRKD